MQNRLLISVILLLAMPSIWSQTSPYNLQKALQTARNNSPLLKPQQYNVAIAEADVVTASLRPNLILNNQTLNLVQPSHFPANTNWYSGQNRQVWWQLTKPFQLPAQRKYKIKVAEQNVLLEQKVIKEAERNLFQDVAIQWLDVWTTRKQLDLLMVAKSNTDSLVVVNQLRYKNQVITETELIRTSLLADQYALQLKSAEQTYQNALVNLQFLLGSNEAISIDTSDRFLYELPASLDSLLKQALNSRSDLQTLKSVVNVADANIQLQKAFAWPQPELGVIYNPQNTIPYIGIYGTIELPVFSRNQGEIKKALVLKQQAEQQLQTTQTQLQTELTTAYQIYQTQQANLTKFDQLLAQSEKILMSVKYSYLRGGTTIVDFLEAQRSWLETQQQYYETLQGYKQSYIRLLYVSGYINQLAQ
ncbi:Outer membrane efflux protein [compost metagenome]